MRITLGAVLLVVERHAVPRPAGAQPCSRTHLSVWWLAASKHAFSIQLHLADDCVRACVSMRSEEDYDEAALRQAKQ